MASKHSAQRSAKIRQLIREGVPRRQAEAIAYREYGENGPFGNPPVFLLYLKTKNDVNGNPRKMFVTIYRDGGYELTDYGYEGLFQLPPAVRELEPFPIDITPGAYAALKRDLRDDPTRRKPRR